MANRQNQYTLSYVRLDLHHEKSPSKRPIDTFECKATSVPRAISKLHAKIKTQHGVGKSDILVLSAQLVG